MSVLYYYKQRTQKIPSQPAEIELFILAGEKKLEA